MSPTKSVAANRQALLQALKDEPSFMFAADLKLQSLISCDELELAMTQRADQLNPEPIPEAQAPLNPQEQKTSRTRDEARQQVAEALLE